MSGSAFGAPRVTRLDKASTRARQKTDDPVVRGKRNKRYGARRQADVRKFFERLTNTKGKFAGHKANEESWGWLPVRLEVKSGVQCTPTATSYLKAETQSDQSKPFGDIRPFIYASAPEGMSDFLIVIRASKFEDVIQSLGYYHDSEPY